MFEDLLSPAPGGVRRRRGWRARCAKRLPPGFGQEPRAERKYIRIIMFPAIAGGSSIIAQGGADARHFVGGDGGADARAIDDDAARGFSVGDDFGHSGRDVGIVDWRFSVGADVVDGESELGEDWQQRFFQNEPTVIRSQRDGFFPRRRIELIVGDFDDLDASLADGILSRGRYNTSLRNFERARKRDLGSDYDFAHFKSA